MFTKIFTKIIDALILCTGLLQIGGGIAGHFLPLDHPASPIVAEVSLKSQIIFSLLFASKFIADVVKKRKIQKNERNSKTDG